MLLTGAPVSKETSNRQLPDRKEEEEELRKEGWDDDEWEVRLIREGRVHYSLDNSLLQIPTPFWTAVDLCQLVLFWLLILGFLCLIPRPLPDFISQWPGDRLFTGAVRDWKQD